MRLKIDHCTASAKSENRKIMKTEKNRKTVIVRGGGDLATGIIYRLWRSCFDVICLEIPSPTVVRRSVAVARVVYDGDSLIEDMDVCLAENPDQMDFIKGINVLIDPEGDSIALLRPFAVIDAMMSKRKTATNKNMADLVLAIGPGFSAPEDVHGIIETKRGHSLGRLITKGSAEANTGIPGEVLGYTCERLLRSPSDGYLSPVLSIGERVKEGDVIGSVNGIPVKAQIGGVVRGLIHPSVLVREGSKIGDIDPRNELGNCFIISDKALAVGGGVLEAILRFEARGRLD
ncbi:MAG: selenium-dependent molybdenum cofactor biosynthesis protein YqeB [Synergistota bacterium]|nr:selenium-dependent molybdenum cofactor biosynthesis protein YqeB [Synergistota bacterium]